MWHYGSVSFFIWCIINYLLLVCRWAGEASAFSARVIPVIVQPVLEHVDWSRLNNMTWQFISCVDDSLAEEILSDLSGCLWFVEFQTVASQMTGCWVYEELTFVYLFSIGHYFENLNQITSEPSLLDRIQSEGLQSFFIGNVLQSLNHLCCCALATFQAIDVFL